MADTCSKASPPLYFSHLVGTQTVTNVDEEETYTITARMAPVIAIETNPPAMTIGPGESQKFNVTLAVRSTTGAYSFGEVVLKGNRGHKVRMPVVAMGYDR
ncbi:subtilisin-like serine protease 3 [Artemisia annua]|uniref:Subtilisin-like serine protease 3 n=1 Tax=Artemisia annua TaxID=35608 RepID=A0A2U1PB84_ARTAN|nr:subtilisin-like serine protease 3 [Artemisia annua]